MEDDLNFKVNGRRLQVKFPYLALASPDLGTAQPQLVLLSSVKGATLPSLRRRSERGPPLANIINNNYVLYFLASSVAPGKECFMLWNMNSNPKHR